MYVDMCVYVCICVYLCVYVCLCDVYACLCVCMCVYVYIHICICIYIGGFGGHTSILFWQLRWLPESATQIFQKAQIMETSASTTRLCITIFDFWVVQIVVIVLGQWMWMWEIPSKETQWHQHIALKKTSLFIPKCAGFCTGWKLSEQWHHLKFQHPNLNILNQFFFFAWLLCLHDIFLADLPFLTHPGGSDGSLVMNKKNGILMGIPEGWK